MTGGPCHRMYHTILCGILELPAGHTFLVAEVGRVIVPSCLFLSHVASQSTQLTNLALKGGLNPGTFADVILQTGVSLRGLHWLFTDGADLRKQLLDGKSLDRHYWEQFVLRLFYLNIRWAEVGV